MSERKTSLDERTKNLMEARSSTEALDAQLAIIEKEYAQISKEGLSLDMMLLHLLKAVKLPKKSKLIMQTTTNLNKTLNLPEIPFLNVSS
jgi:hypothetical protein